MSADQHELDRSQSPPVPRELVRQNSPAEACRHVLLLEDNPGDERLIRELLRETADRSFLLEHADRLAGGVQRLYDGGIDVLLLDLGLPDCQGLATFRQARAAAPQVPIVVLSGLEDRQLQQQAVREGAQDYLVKGTITAEILGRVLTYAIERAHLLAAEQTARSQAESAVRARDEFISVAAHELRTPVSALLAMAQLARRRFEHAGGPDQQQVGELVVDLSWQADRLNRLTSKLLDTSRLKAGTLELQPESTDLVGLVREVARSAHLQQREIVVRGPCKLAATVDPLRLEQVVRNLLDNAIKYSPAGGPIEVDLSEPGPGEARLAVRDYGIGIPPEHRPSIFEPFYRAHPDGRTSGMGLGLHISREIIEQHGGRIWAEFPVDGGTRFVLALPTAGNGQ